MLRIHKSTVRRLRNVRIKERSHFAVVLLLMATEDLDFSFGRLGIVLRNVPKNLHSG